MEYAAGQSWSVRSDRRPARADRALRGLARQHVGTDTRLLVAGGHLHHIGRNRLDFVPHHTIAVANRRAFIRSVRRRKPVCIGAQHVSHTLLSCHVDFDRSHCCPGSSKVGSPIADLDSVTCARRVRVRTPHT